MQQTLSRFNMLVLCTFLIACTANPNGHPHDPYESANRKVFAFNQVVTRHVVRPVGTIYSDLVPDVVQHGIHNFFQNLEDPFSSINHLLQGHWKKAGLSLWRFTINTTIGIGGLIDVATGSGLPAYPQNFSQTLSHYGCKNQVYFVLPLLGPKVTCEVVSIPFDYYFFDFWPYVQHQEAGTADGLLITRTVDSQSRMLDVYRMVDAAFDPYIFMRHGYLSKYNLNVKPDHDPEHFDDDDEHEEAAVNNDTTS